MVRDEIVARGLAFMRNPKVAETDMSKKVAFLENKGLTADELAEVVKQYEAQPEDSTKSAASGPAARPAGPQPTAASIRAAIAALRGKLQPEAERAALQATITVLEHALADETGAPKPAPAAGVASGGASDGGEAAAVVASPAKPWEGGKKA